jgi:hypothetical protein
MNKAFIFILGIVAIVLAATTAFFSVYGLSKLFMGAATAVIILFGTLEFSKIVLVSFYHQFNKRLKGGFKGLMIFFISLLMLITSIGVYGFLSSAYSSTSVKLEKMDGQINVYNKKN